MQEAKTTENNNDAFIPANGPCDHPQRRSAMLKRYPELQHLAGYNRASFLWLIVLVVTQLAIGLGLEQTNFWITIIGAYFIGSLVSMGILVLVHEASHGLVAKTSWANTLALLVANLGIMWPAGIAYKRYHLNHHRYVGYQDGDVDMPATWEAKWVGNKFWRKLVWLALFPVIYSVTRNFADKKVRKLEPLFLISIVVQVTVLVLMLRADLDLTALYLAMSPLCAISLSPAMGARGLIEHFAFDERQETYSYYGPYNKIMFNVGLHTEHHDFPYIPWNRLPEVTATANEFYANRYAHRSYVAILRHFLFDPQMTLYRRVVRQPKSETNRQAA